MRGLLFDGAAELALPLGVFKLELWLDFAAADSWEGIVCCIVNGVEQRQTLAAHTGVAHYAQVLECRESRNTLVVTV